MVVVVGNFDACFSSAIGSNCLFTTSFVFNSMFWHVINQVPSTADSSLPNVFVRLFVFLVTLQPKTASHLHTVPLMCVAFLYVGIIHTNVRNLGVFKVHAIKTRVGGQYSCCSTRPNLDPRWRCWSSPSLGRFILGTNFWEDWVGSKVDLDGFKKSVNCSQTGVLTPDLLPAA
jgi:hypothetical protein